MESHDLRSGRVRLRPLERADLELLVAGRDDGVWPPFAADERSVRRAQQRKIDRSGRFAEGRLDLGIEVDRRLVGTIEARQPAGALPPGVFELGISLFEPSDRGQGFGTTAVELFTGFLFSDASTYRVQASTWVDNLAMRRVFEKVGFTFEGVMHAFMPVQGGGRHDYALYAVTRAAWGRRRRPAGRVRPPRSKPRLRE
jgi:RimJ/RimL family protein N-acetyltransferase